MMMVLHMLTTTDNPYNPFTDFTEWNNWDTRNGYHTMSFLARLVYTSHDLSPADQDLAIELAIDEIVKENILGIYAKVQIPLKPPYPEDPALAMLD